MTRGIWIRVDHVVVIRERFVVLKRNALSRNVEQMKFLLPNLINVVPDAKRVSFFFKFFQCCVTLQKSFLLHNEIMEQIEPFCTSH